jgi:hypothetical protein
VLLNPERAMSDLRKNFSNNFNFNHGDSDMQSQHSFKSVQPSASVRSFNYSPAKGKPASGNKTGLKRSASPKKSPKKKSPKKKTPTKEELAKKAKLL